MGGGGHNRNGLVHYFDRVNRENENKSSRNGHYATQNKCRDDEVVIAQATQQDNASCHSCGHSIQLNGICSKNTDGTRIKYKQRTWLAVFAFLCIALGFLLALTVTSAFLSASKTATGQITFDIKSPTMTINNGLKLHYKGDATTNTGNLTYGSTTSAGTSIASLEEMWLSVDEQNIGSSYYLKVAYDFSGAQGTVSFNQSVAYRFSTGEASPLMSAMKPVSTNYFESTSLSPDGAPIAVPKGKLFNIFAYLNHMSYTNSATYNNTSIPFTITVVVDTKSSYSTTSRAQMQMKGILGIDFTGKPVVTPTVTGEYSIFWYDSTDGWKTGVDSNGYYDGRVSAYDPARAIQKTSVWETGDSITYANDVAYGGDRRYGKIKRFMGLSDSGSSQWNVLIYVNNEWKLAPSRYLGEYRCFSDYDKEYRTANIALYYGPENSERVNSMIDSLNAFIDDEFIGLSNETPVGTRDEFKFSIYLKFKYTGLVSENIKSSGNVSITVEQLENGVTINAYGSDLIRALKWAFGTNLLVREKYEKDEGEGYSLEYYPGYIYSLFGHEAIQTEGVSTPSDWTDDRYLAWAVYSSHQDMGDTSNQYYNDGLYTYITTIKDGPWRHKRIALVYDEHYANEGWIPRAYYGECYSVNY